MAKNNNLHKAKTAKNDEFYTQLTDIEEELKHYKQHFENKIIFCNCDDPYKLKKYNKTDYKNANDLNARACIIANGEPKSIYPRILIKKRIWKEWIIQLLKN